MNIKGERVSVKTTHELAKALFEKEDCPLILVCPDKIKSIDHEVVQIGISNMPWLKGHMYVGYKLERTLWEHGFGVEGIEDI